MALNICEMLSNGIKITFFKPKQTKKTRNRLAYGVGLFKKTIFSKSEAANGFSRCITPKNDLDQFSQKNFAFYWVRNSVLVCDVLKKVKKLFFGKHWQVPYPQTQNDSLSRNFFDCLVY